MALMKTITRQFTKQLQAAAAHRRPPMPREAIEEFIIQHIDKHGQFTDADRGRWFAAAKRLVKSNPALELVFHGDSERVVVHGKSRYYPSHWSLQPKKEG